MPSNVSADGAELKRIAACEGGLQMPSPGTLQRMEDPRAWHARGEVGIQHPRRPAGPSGVGAIALPMAPPLPKGRMVPTKKTVLEEEEYVDRLGEIIEGDYFPHNAKMHRTLADLAGNSNGNTPSRTPSSVVRTPSSVIGMPTPGGSVPRPGGELGANGSGGGSGLTSSSKEAGTGGALTKFVATHTSEDNEAFAELQEKDQEAFRRRYFWAYDTTPDGEGVNATSTKLLILPNGKMMSVERREQMDAACADRPKIGDDRPNQVETWKHRTRNQLMFSPNLVASNDICRIEQDPAATAPLLLKDGTSKLPTARTKRRLIKQSEEVVRKVMKADQGFSDADDAPSEPPRAAGRGGSPSPSRDSSSSSYSKQTREEGAAAISSGRMKEGGGAATAAAEGASVDNPLRPSSDLYSDENGSDSWSSQSPQQQEHSSSSLPTKEPSPPPPVARDTVAVKTNPKVIQAHATRFPAPQPRPPRRGPWLSPIEKPSSSRESVAEMLAGTTEDAGYEEVPMTPSRVPGVDGDSPQITWGSIDGTPMILDPRATPLPGGDGPGSVPGGAMDAASFIGTLGGISSGGHQFEMKDLPARDKLAHRLEAVDTRRKRAKLGVGEALDGRGTRTPLPATPLPGSVQRTPGTGKRTPGTVGSGTPGGAKTRGGGRSSGKTAPSTPAARSLAAKLARRQRADTPFGGGLTPGRQKRRSSRSGRGSGTKEDGLTPLPGTPARSATPVAASGKLRAAGGKRSSLTDGLLSLK